MEEAKGWTSPFGDSRTAQPAIVAEGKKLYEGKGSCILCHGITGRSDGSAAHMHHPYASRDFTDCAFQNARTDGELFGTIKYGSPGTGIVPLVPGTLERKKKHGRSSPTYEPSATRSRFIELVRGRQDASANTPAKNAHFPLVQYHRVGKHGYKLLRRGGGSPSFSLGLPRR